MNKTWKYIFTICIAVSMAVSCSKNDTENDKISTHSPSFPLTSFPVQIDKNCRNGRAKIYDECSDQVKLFKAANMRAKEEGKVLLVSYGAEWCIWCHVFDAYIRGDVEKFKYTYGEPGKDKRWTETMYERADHDVSKEAENLAKFVSESFVLVHIDYEHSPDGRDVLSISDALDGYSGGLPYIFTVNDNGKFAATFSHDDAEIRRDTDDWYRGYDRKNLLLQLKNMQTAALR